MATGVVHNEIDASVVQDLDIKFQDIVAEQKCGDNGSASKHIQDIVYETTHVKRVINKVADENDRGSSRVIKTIMRYWVKL